MTEKRQRYLERRTKKEKAYKETINARETANRKSDLEDIAEEIGERETKIEAAMVAYRNMLPMVVARLQKIKDYRNPLKLKHKLSVLMAYGILMFVFRIGSRRECNRILTKPIFFKNLKMLFPEIESMPHADTLYRLLENIDVSQIENTLIELFRKFIRNKKFKNFLFNGRYLFAIDGTQKHVSDTQWDEKWLKKTFNKSTDKEKVKYSVYVLECVFVLDNGITLPLYSEFLDNEDYIEGENKQDSELKAFYRLAKRIKKDFPKLKISLTLDGIFANGQVIQMLRQYKWDFMIAFKRGSIPTLFDEAEELMHIEVEDNNNTVECEWGNQEQIIMWINDVEYICSDKKKKAVKVHVVKCIEKGFKEERNTGEIKETVTKYVWISDKKLTSKNVLKRANFMGRYRWCIENNFLVLKTSAYGYEHFYAFSWNAMKGYHYLLNIGRFFNVIMIISEKAFDIWIENQSITSFISDIKELLAAQVVEEAVAKKVVKKRRLKLIAI